jgi:hypothetical protein
MIRYDTSSHTSIIIAKKEKCVCGGECLKACQDEMEEMRGVARIAQPVTLALVPGKDKQVF